MRTIPNCVILNTVLHIYTYINSKLDFVPIQQCEESLWFEWCACLLSSQVPYDIAWLSAQRIKQRGVLRHDDLDENDVRSLLLKPVNVNGHRIRYRFPNIKARQLVQSRNSVFEEFGSLTEFTHSFENGAIARRWLVENASGFGPKQSSMFLRNVGMSLDLAVIDRHVLDYMSTFGIGEVRPSDLANLSEYEIQELRLKKHSDSLGVQIGVFDRAIWTVMKVVKEEVKAS